MNNPPYRRWTRRNLPPREDGRDQHLLWLLLLLLLGLRHVFYLVMLFLRVPVQIICRLAVYPLLLVAMVWALIAGWTSMPAILLGCSAVAFFLFGYFFDTLLLKISRDPIYLDM